MVVASFRALALWDSLDSQLSCVWKFQSPCPPHIKVTERIISETLECKYILNVGGGLFFRRICGIFLRFQYVSVTETWKDHYRWGAGLSKRLIMRGHKISCSVEKRLLHSWLFA